MNLHTTITAFLERESHRGLDFSECLVVAPHHHLGQAFRQALTQRMGSALLPPRIVTLPDLADDFPDVRRPLSEGHVLAVLHDILSRLPQVMPRASLWPAARELASLMAEMEAAGLADDVLEPLVTSPNLHLSAEAAIANTVWRVCRTELPREDGLRSERLLALARQADRPLYHLGLLEPTPRERAFFTQWSQRHPVIGLPLPPEQPGRRALLDAAWEAQGAALRQRAQAFALDLPASPVVGDWSLLAARSLEGAAQAASRQVMRWLGEGRQRIALIALDRMLSRRVRALLERHAILIQDETGWALSTASASHVLDRWVGLLGPAMPHGDLLDLLKSPFIAVAAEPDQAVVELEQAIRRHGPARDLEGHIALAREQGLLHAQEALSRIAQARSRIPRGRASLGEWTQALLSSLDLLGAQALLSADPIGAKVLELLQRLERDAAGHLTLYPLADWRRWLALHLEEGVFSDTLVESPIRLTHLAAAHHRDWDAALLLGAGAAHLPGRLPAQIFNDATRRQLGLPGPSEREASQRAALADLMDRAGQTALVWQQEEAGEEMPLSPWLLQLDVFHELAWGAGLPRPGFAPIESGDLAPLLDGDQAPVQAQPPSRLSASAWQSLLNCPYQFHARYQLGLDAPDEVTEELEKSDYGTLIHRILAAFHTAHPNLAAYNRTTLEQALAQQTEAAFAADIARDFAALSWRERWQRQIPAYVDWALAFAAEGHQSHLLETELSREVIWPNRTGASQSTLVVGRADRIDLLDGHPVVLDYKTQTRAKLKKKAGAEAEDVQLPLYAWLTGAIKAGFVALDDKQKVDLIPWAGSLEEAAEAESERLRDTFAAMAAGRPLPAQGAPEVCQWCEMRGLCRAEHQAT